ncbi:hypothetical protein STXM2123_4177 [Streptomyces sp. F-3]|nr:hypothetical protein STXM2123_4177 [Streptomyces sp. F-3]
MLRPAPDTAGTDAVIAERAAHFHEAGHGGEERPYGHGHDRRTPAGGLSRGRPSHGPGRRHPGPPGRSGGAARPGRRPRCRRLLPLRPSVP